MASLLPALRVAQYPAAILRQRAAPVTAQTPDFARLVAGMLLAVRQQKGLGLAGPQVERSLRVFVMQKPTAWTEKEAKRQSSNLRRGLSIRPIEYIAVANPVILKKSEDEDVGIEACLSIPDYPCLVRRPFEIEVSYSDVTSLAAPFLRPSTPATAAGGGAAAAAGGGALAQTQPQDEQQLAKALSEDERTVQALSGLPAVVFQHELDHCDGLLILDRKLSEARLGPGLTMEEAQSQAGDKFTAEVRRYYLNARSR